MIRTPFCCSETNHPSQELGGAPSRSNRALRGPAQRTLAWLLLAVGVSLALSSTSCSGDKTDEADPALVEKSRTAAVEARDAAEDAGADKMFADEFEACEDKLSSAEDLVLEGKGTDAKRRLTSLKRDFDRLRKKAEDIADKRKAALALRAEVERAKKNALQLKAPENAPDTYAEAEQYFKKALEQVNAADAKSISQARISFERARGAYVDALDESRENKLLRQKIDKEKGALEKLKEQLTEAEALKYAPQDLVSAQQQERDADTELEAGNFSRALDQYTFASQSYAQALQSAITNKNLAELAAPPDTTGFIDPGDVAVADTGAEPGPMDVGEPLTGDEPIVDVGEVPSGLSDTDAIIAEHIGKLLPSLETGANIYDPVTNEIRLAYDSGAMLKKDIPEANIKRIRKTHIRFKDPMDIGGPAVPGADPAEVSLSFSFHGNTDGFFTLPIPLTGKITLQYQVNLMVMDNGGSMGPVLYANESGTTLWWVDWVSFRKYTYKRAPKTAGPRDPAYRKDANYWFDKVNTVTMRIEAVPDEDAEGKSRLQVYYQPAENLDPINVSPTFTTTTSGFIGFKWNRVKFNIRSLRITGELDKEEALKLLKKKGVDTDAASSTEEASTGATPSGGASTTPTGDAGSGDFDF